MILSFNDLWILRMESFASKFKKGIKILAKILAVIFLISVVLTDLERPDGGYIMWVIVFVVSAAVSSYKEVQEITHTPIASLTLAKIATLVFYFYVAWILLVIGRTVWSEISEYLEEREDRRFEQEREAQRLRRMEEEIYSGEAQKRCADCVAAMELTDSLSELESLYREAVSNWPKWEKSLSRVYKKIKKNLEKSEKNER